MSDSREDDSDSYGETDMFEVEREAAQSTLTLSPEDTQVFLDLLNQIGPTPPIESRKFMMLRPYKISMTCTN
jgi:hypothetical protein